MINEVVNGSSQTVQIVSQADALASIPHTQRLPFASIISNRHIDVEIYSPLGLDRQTPHTRDEIYVVTNGCGRFVSENSQRQVKTGDLIFVPAGVAHKFEDFTEPFVVWVFFFG